MEDWKLLTFLILTAQGKKVTTIHKTLRARHEGLALGYSIVLRVYEIIKQSTWGVCRTSVLLKSVVLHGEFHFHN